MTDILRREHQPPDQPVLGQVRDHGARWRPPAGDAQDRYEQRRQGPQRVRLHRPADRGRPQGRCVRAGRRRLERQQRQHGGRRGLLDRRRRRTSGRASCRKPRAKWELTRFERPEGLTQVAIDPFTGLLPAEGTEGVEEWFIGDSGPKHAGRRPRSAARSCSWRPRHERKFANWIEADRDWIARARAGARYPRRAREHADRVLLQQPVPPVRPLVGRGRRWRWLRLAEPVADLLHHAHA